MPEDGVDSSCAVATPEDSTLPTSKMAAALALIRLPMITPMPKPTCYARVGIGVKCSGARFGLQAPRMQQRLGVPVGLLEPLEHEIDRGEERRVAVPRAGHRAIGRIAGIL